MCLIVDADTIHKVIPKPKKDYVPVYDAIYSGTAILVYGGHLTTEYMRCEHFWRILIRLDQQGRARQINGSRVRSLTEKMMADSVGRSNDQHILALARVSGVRLLCSNDDALCEDFRNPSIIANPRGNVYKRPQHRALIRAHCGRLPPRSRH